MFGKHSHGDSRLTCIDCGEIICAKCLVQCPVGFRCRPCTGKFKSHLIVVSPWIVFRTVVSCIVLGSIYGFVMPHGCPSWFTFLLPYIVGALCGKVVHRIAGFKLGGKVIATIASGLVVGMLLSPMTNELYMIIMASLSVPTEPGEQPAIVSSMTIVICTVGPAAIFVIGVLSPILWGYRRSG